MTRDSKKNSKKNADSEGQEASDREASSDKMRKHPKNANSNKRETKRKVQKAKDKEATEKQSKAKDEEASEKQASNKQASDREASSGDGDDLKLYQDKSSKEYITFIHSLRERLRETAFGDIFVLPRAKEPLEYVNVQVVIDEVKKIKVKIRRDNAYAVAFSICGGGDIEGVWFWFDDHSRSRDDETLGMEGNYICMTGAADWKNTNGLGNVKIGRDDIDAAYYGLRRYLTEKQKDTKMKKRVIAYGARAILTILIVVCEAARFDDIKETVVDKYESDYEMLEGPEEEKRVENRIKSWSTHSKRLDKDIRLFQFADWMMIPQAKKSRLEAAKEGVDVAIPAKERVEVAIPAKEGVEVAIPDSLRLKGYDCVEVLADGKRYAMRKICPDGNCQFRSLSHQLDENEEKYEEVREKVFNQLKKDPGRYKGFYATEGREEKTYDEYVQEMSMNYCWGDDISLSAAADAYNSRVVLMVWNASEEKWDKNVRVPKGEIIEREIYLRFRGKHYDSITPVDFQDEEHE